MASNWYTKMAWEYHEATKHSYASIRANPHFLDWANQPVPFKIYPTLERVRLPGEVRPTAAPLYLRSPKAFPLTQWRYPMLLLVQLRGGGIAGGRKYFKILRNKSPRLDHFSTPLY